MERQARYNLTRAEGPRTATALLPLVVASLLAVEKPDDPFHTAQANAIHSARERTADGDQSKFGCVTPIYRQRAA
jgi:hypothetical protein